MFLVDFGAVQDVYRNTLSSWWYVRSVRWVICPQNSSEEKLGQLLILYGVGASLLFLLTGRSPDDFPQRRPQGRFSPLGLKDFSWEFVDWLERFLEPAIENRFTSAKEALESLGKVAPYTPRGLALTHGKPLGTQDCS